MDWALYFLIAVIIGIFIKRIILMQTNFGPASNALLAEHYLSTIALDLDYTFSKELGKEIADICRLAGFPMAKDSLIFRQFNRSSRFQQLLLIAMALDKIDHQPKLPNEYWHSVRNPFKSGIENKSRLDAVAQRIASTHNIVIRVRSNKFHLDGHGLSYKPHLFSGGKPSKIDLIKKLAKDRVRKDPMAESLGYNEGMVDSLGTMELMSTPEGTLVTIVETYALLLKSGEREEFILNHIENHRAQLGVGAMPIPLNLESYIKYRIEMEHSHGAPISEEFISRAISVARSQYGF